MRLPHAAIGRTIEELTPRVNAFYDRGSGVSCVHEDDVFSKAELRTADPSDASTNLCL